MMFRAIIIRLRRVWQTFCLHANRLLTSVLSALGVAGHPAILTIRNFACPPQCVWTVFVAVTKFFCLAVALLVLCVVFTWKTGIGPIRLPVELFWWPQASSLGGAGFPPPEPLPVAVLLNSCPNGRPRWPPPTSANNHEERWQHQHRQLSASSLTPSAASSLSSSRFSTIRRSPRWVLHDLPCLNISHLDAGVCIASSPPSPPSSSAWFKGAAGGDTEQHRERRRTSQMGLRVAVSPSPSPSLSAPASSAWLRGPQKEEHAQHRRRESKRVRASALRMRCLPSFLVIGAQKAGSTDLRGLLSFHPYLDGPSSEVRFFTHINSPDELEKRWREYLSWFPAWPLPAPATSAHEKHNGVSKAMAAAVHSVAPKAKVFLSPAAGGGGNYGRHGSSAQWTYEKSPAYLGSGGLAPSLAKLLLPSLKLVAILRNPTSRAYSAFQHNCRFGRWRRHREKGAGKGASAGVGGGVGEEGAVISCDAEHDEKFARSPSSSSSSSSSLPNQQERQQRCAEATALRYPCSPRDFHDLIHFNFKHLLPSNSSSSSSSAAPAPAHRSRSLKRKGGGGGGGNNRRGQGAEGQSGGHTEEGDEGGVVGALLAVKGDAGSIISKGLYAHFLGDWLAHFPPQQLTILLFEDFYRQGVSESIKGVTRFLGLPDFDVTEPKGFSVYEWYNGAQRERNKYQTMSPETKRALDHLFCEPNKQLESLLRGLNEKLTQANKNSRGSSRMSDSQGGSKDSTGWVQVPRLLPEHGYSCVGGSEAA